MGALASHLKNPPWPGLLYPWSMSWSRNRELFTTTRLLLPSSVVVYALELKPSKQPSNSEFSIVPLFRKSFSTQSSRMNLKYAFRTVQSASPCASMLAPSP